MSLQRYQDFIAERTRLLERIKELEADGNLAPASGVLDITTALRQERKQRSIALQNWLFEQFVMLNSRGGRKNLIDIFKEAEVIATTKHHYPPGGAGECAAPKLLQYAFLHKLHPIAMAEFWWGNSPKNEERIHGHFYPACEQKCRPILTYMLS